MRKTKLWFEKESTPEFYKPRVTRFGKSVTMKKESICNLSRSKRFAQYDIDANRVGRNVGPGAYMQFHYCISSRHSQSPKQSKYFYRHMDLLNNAHYYYDYSTTKPNFLKNLSV